MKTNKKNNISAMNRIRSTKLDSILELKVGHIIISGIYPHRPLILSQQEIEDNPELLSEISLGFFPKGYQDHLFRPGYRTLPPLEEIEDIPILGKMLDATETVITPEDGIGESFNQHVCNTLYSSYLGGVDYLNQNLDCKKLPVETAQKLLQQMLESVLRSLGVVSNLDGELTVPAKQLVSELLHLAKEELDG